MTDALRVRSKPTRPAPRSQFNPAAYICQHQPGTPRSRRDGFLPFIQKRREIRLRDPLATIPLGKGANSYPAARRHGSYKLRVMYHSSFFALLPSFPVALWRAAALDFAAGLPVAQGLAPASRVRLRGCCCPA